MHNIVQQKIFESIQLSTLVGIDSSRWVLERRSCDYDSGFFDGLDELFQRSNDANVFFSKGFFSASFERLGKIPKYLLITWEILGEEKIPRMVFPIENEKIGLPLREVWRVSTSPYSPLSTPLVHEDDPETAVSKFVELLQKCNDKMSGVIFFDDLDCSSSFFRQVQKIDPEREHSIVFGETSRSVLMPFKSVDEFQKYSLKPKRLRELRRQMKRIGEIGKLELETVSSPSNVQARFEEFMLLEMQGWKGRNHTALCNIRSNSAFARQAVFNLSNEQACSIISLRVDDQPLASLVLFRFNNWYFPWKIAYDETFSSYAPGMVLFWQASLMLLQIEGFEGADSLAAKHSELTNSNWKDHMTLSRLILPIGNSKLDRAKRVQKAIERTHSIKKTAKKLLNRQ